MKTEQEADIAKLGREVEIAQLQAKNASLRRSIRILTEKREWIGVKAAAEAAIKNESAIVALKRGTPSDTPARGMRRVRVNG